jgi:hypothetical protein
VSRVNLARLVSKVRDGTLVNDRGRYVAGWTLPGGSNVWEYPFPSLSPRLYRHVPRVIFFR